MKKVLKWIDTFRIFYTVIVYVKALRKGVSVTESGVVVGAIFITTILCTSLCAKFVS